MASKPAAAPCLAESWEEIDEDRLPATIKILKNTSSPKAEQEGGEKTGRVNGSSTARQATLPETLEEELKPKMVQRPMQILRRPQSNSSTDKSPLESKPKAQPKSLDQRKQEYAEARLRILGSAHAEEDETESNKKTSSPANGSRTNANNNNTNNNSGSSSNSSSSGNNTVGNVATGGSGVGGGASANNNGGGGGNNFRHFHPPYRQQQPVFYSSPPPLPTLPNHPAMHGSHPAMQHHPHHNPFPNGGLPLPYQQHQPQHPHYGPPMNGPSPHPYFNGGGPRAGGLAGGNSGGGAGGAGGGGGYYSKGSAYGGGAGGIGVGVSDMNGVPGPLMSLMGHSLSMQHPGGHPAAAYSGIGYGGAGGGGGGGKGSPGTGPPPNGGNQHLLRLPAGPDGSQGFNMRR